MIYPSCKERNTSHFKEVVLMKKINYVGFLSLLSLIAILGFTTNNKGLLGFLGFLYYLRYFFIIPDELFLSHVQKSATLALMFELLSLVPFLFIFSYTLPSGKAVPTAFALSFVFAVFLFTFSLIVLERKEGKYACHD